MRTNSALVGLACVAMACIACLAIATSNGSARRTELFTCGPPPHLPASSHPYFFDATAGCGGLRNFLGHY